MSVARSRRLIAAVVTIIVGVVVLATFVRGQERQGGGERGAGAAAGQGRGEGRGRGPAMKLSDPVITDFVEGHSGDTD